MNEVFAVENLLKYVFVDPTTGSRGVDEYDSDQLVDLLLSAKRPAAYIRLLEDHPVYRIPAGTLLPVHRYDNEYNTFGTRTHFGEQSIGFQVDGDKVSVELLPEQLRGDEVYNCAITLHSMRTARKKPSNNAELPLAELPLARLPVENVLHINKMLQERRFGCQTEAVQKLLSLLGVVADSAAYSSTRPPTDAVIRYGDNEGIPRLLTYHTKDAFRSIVDHLSESLDTSLVMLPDQKITLSELIVARCRILAWRPDVNGTSLRPSPTELKPYIDSGRSSKRRPRGKCSPPVKKLVREGE